LIICGIICAPSLIETYFNNNAHDAETISDTSSVWFLLQGLKMNFKKEVVKFSVIGSVILLSGCASLINDANIPLTFSFSDGSSGECTFKNKRGVWSSVIPTQGVMIRRSDDALMYECTTVDGRKAVGSVRSEIEGEKLAASVVFFDLGITDAITDKHRTYQGNVVIPVPAKDA